MPVGRRLKRGRQAVPDGGAAGDCGGDGVAGVCVPDGDDGAGAGAGVQRRGGAHHVCGPAVRGEQAGGRRNSVVCSWCMVLVCDRLASCNEPSLPSPPRKRHPRQRRRPRPSRLPPHHTPPVARVQDHAHRSSANPAHRHFAAHLRLSLSARPRRVLARLEKVESQPDAQLRYVPAPPAVGWLTPHSLVPALPQRKLPRRKPAARKVVQARVEAELGRPSPEPTSQPLTLRSTAHHPSQIPPRAFATVHTLLSCFVSLQLWISDSS